MMTTVSLTRAKSRRGYVLLSVAFLLLVFLGFLGLAIDLGYFFYMRRQMQKATDAAAIGGDHAIFMGQTTQSQIKQAGWTDASQNGFTDCRFNASNCQGSVTVAINNPPATGPYTTDSRAVEAIISEPVPTLFMRAFGLAAVPVRTRAVAHGGSATACIFALDPSVSGALTVAGNAQANISCGVMDDSSSNCALQVNGTTTTLSATSITVTGGECGTGVVSPTPVTGQPPAPDPLAYLSAPTFNNTCDFTNTIITTQGTVNLTPGVYCGGIVVASQATVNFAPGLYVLAGGQTCSVCSPTGTYGIYTAGGSAINGTGVTFYNTGSFGSSSCSQIYISGTTTANLTAPTGGGNYGQFDTGGILFFQNRSCSTSALVAGTNNSNYVGAFYFLDSNLSYKGTSQTAITSPYTILVANTINIQGTPNFNNDYSSLPAGSPIKGVVLGE